MDALFRVEMLGRFRVLQDSREISRFRTQKTAALLAYLALYCARSHPREVLLEQFWPDSTLEAARSNLSVALNALRKQLEPPGVPAGAVVIADHTQVRLNPMAFTSDVEDLEQALRAAELETEADRRMAAWRRAVDLYAGDLMPGFYEEWVLAERERLRDAYRTALRQIVKEYAETRQFEPAIAYAHRLVQADPLREESYRHLMRLYVAVGRPADALYQYEELERLLLQELQTEPAAATRELAEQLRDADPKRRTTGEARAADSQPKEATATGQTSPVEAPRPTLKIPLQFTRFFGREEAIAHLIEALSAPPVESEHPTLHGQHPRLLTLTGPGGTGKTRLSIEVAGRVKESFPGGVWFIPLAELRDPRLLGEALRDTLALPRQTQGAALDQVSAFLSAQSDPSLLILDNFEQITAGGAPVVWTLLNRVPLLRCLVTSRQPLSLPGEREVPVSPLPIPALEPPTPAPSLLTTHLLGYASVALFVDRAQAARPEFQITPRNAEAIAAICEKLEGLPLAIELAAVRSKALTPSQILERLSDRFELLASRQSDKGERHRSLWAAIDWSYTLLPAGLQQLLARLSVFRGGWSLEAAETVCEEPAALDYLSQLRGHSLILAHESTTALRFGMLEAIREFAAEQTIREERGRTVSPDVEEGWELAGTSTALRNRHLAFFQAAAEEAETRESSSERSAWLEGMEIDHDNLRAALDWCLESPAQSQAGLRMAGALWRFWHMRGYPSEGRTYLDAVLNREEARERTGERGQALNGAGVLAYIQGDYADARSYFDESLSIAKERDDREGIANALSNLGVVAYRQGDYAAARAYYEESLEIRKAANNRDGIAACLNNLGNVASDQGDYAGARAYYEESLAIRRELEDRQGIALSLHSLGNVAYVQADYAGARAYYEESLAIQRGMGDKRGIAYSLGNLGSVASQQGDYAAARTLQEESLALRKELGDRLGIAFSLNDLAIVAIRQGDAAAALPLLKESLALSQELGNREGIISSLEVFAGIYQAQGQEAQAARLWGAADTFREEMHFSLPPNERNERDPQLVLARDRLGEERFATAWAEGRTMTLEQAVEEALAETVRT